MKKVILMIICLSSALFFGCANNSGSQDLIRGVSWDMSALDISNLEKDGYFYMEDIYLIPVTTEMGYDCSLIYAFDEENKLTSINLQYFDVDKENYLSIKKSLQGDLGKPNEVEIETDVIRPYEKSSWDCKDHAVMMIFEKDEDKVLVYYNKK